MADHCDDVIDLSESFIPADHRALTDLVIELDTDESGLIELDESIVLVQETDPDPLTPVMAQQAVTLKRNNKRKECTPLEYIHQKYKNEKKYQKVFEKVPSSKEQAKFGECPVCFDPLGQNPLASTICGHIYCMKCIERYLTFDKRCPTCRQTLKGKSSYHPLYLNT